VNEPTSWKLAGTRPQPRPPASFHARRGRVSAAQVEAIATLGPRLQLPVDGEPLDLAAQFGPGTPVILEIGFGTGEVTAAMAAADPSTGLLAVDVHTPGVARLMQLADGMGLTNVRVCDGDAVDLLRMLAPGSLHGIRIFFPDPWPKMRHHKRRLLRPDYSALIADRLAAGGLLHVATDWADYAARITAVLDAEPRLGRAPVPPGRPTTRYERAGLAKGHRVVDVCYARVGADGARDD
jgi:tRNA (guanine-N7-)-methyltransferase